MIWSAISIREDDCSFFAMSVANLNQVFFSYLPKHHDGTDFQRIARTARIDLEGLSQQIGIGLGDEFVDGVNLWVVLVAGRALQLARSHCIVGVRRADVTLQDVECVASSGHLRSDLSGGIGKSTESLVMSEEEDLNRESLQGQFLF